MAGLQAARTLRREGFDGRLTVAGAESHGPYDRPPLSKQVLSESWDEGELTLLREDDDALDIEWKLGAEATALNVADRTVSFGDGTPVAFDGLVIATGATPRRLPGTAHLKGIHVLRSYEDAVALRRDLDAGPARVVVVGSGFVGAEIAAACRRRHLEVTLLEGLPEPFARVLGSDVGAACTMLHRDHGVDVRAGAAVVGFEGETQVSGVLLSGGQRIQADVVVVGVGVVPETGWLQGSGLDISNGVLCNAACQAAPGIVAAGDIARWPNLLFNQVGRVEHWDNALRQGEHAARTLLGDAAPFAPVPWFWSDQYDRKIQLAGNPTGHEEVRLLEDFGSERRLVALYRRGDRLVAVAAINRPRRLAEFRQKIAAGGLWSDALKTARAIA